MRISSTVRGRGSTRRQPRHAELPGGANAAQVLKRIGDWAMKKKIYAAYHTHLQGSMTAFDEAFALSKGNMANVDLGHFVAGGNRAEHRSTSSRSSTIASAACT